MLDLSLTLTVLSGHFICVHGSLCFLHLPMIIHEDDVDDVLGYNPSDRKVNKVRAVTSVHCLSLWQIHC